MNGNISYASGMWSLYVAIAKAHPPHAYFKIGVSSQVSRRMAELQTGCPMPLTEVLVVRAWTYGAALALETQMHEKLHPYRSAGEWFLFDLSDRSHKGAFNDAAREVITPFLGAGWKWTRTRMADLKTAVRELAEEKAEIRRNSRKRTQLQRTEDLLKLKKRMQTMPRS